jgi:hypothetical protein
MMAKSQKMPFAASQTPRDGIYSLGVIRNLGNQELQRPGKQGHPQHFGKQEKNMRWFRSVARSGVRALGATLLLMLPCAVEAQTTIQAEGPRGIMNGRGTGTTLSLKAYSDDGAGVKNPITARIGPLPGAIFTPSRVINLPGGGLYTPVYALAGVGAADPAKPVNAFEQLRSSTAPAMQGGPPGAVGVAWFDSRGGGAAIHVGALVFAAGQSAAAEATDPLTLTQGDYEYSVTGGEITIQLDSPDDFAYASFYGFDSQEDESIPLWILEVQAMPGLADSSQTKSASLWVNFWHDPARLDLLDDATNESIAQGVFDAFILSSDGASYASTLPLFNGIYHVDAASADVTTIGIKAAAEKAP